MWDLFVHYTIFKLFICLIQIVFPIQENHNRTFDSTLYDDSGVFSQAIKSLTFLCNEIIISFTRNLHVKKSLLQAVKISFDKSISIPRMKGKPKSKSISWKSSLSIPKMLH